MDAAPIWMALNSLLAFLTKRQGCLFQDFADADLKFVGALKLCGLSCITFSAA